ncbi:nitrogenase component 1 [Methanotorris formicicus]|nr:nitrogenase component 1 [Methanotorris formicicus]
MEPMQGCRMIGAVRAFIGIEDGYIVLHSPPGCHSGVMMLEVLQDNSDWRIAVSGMHQRDLIYGAEDKCLLAIKKVYENFKPSFIVSMDCCSSGILGEDLESVVENAKKEINTEVIYFSGAGYHSLAYYGYEEALEGLIKFMEQKEIIKNSINLIGIKIDDFKVKEDIEEIKRICNNAGIGINAILTYDTFENIKNAPNAELNVVFGDGIKLAEEMKKKFGIPYVIVDYPYGLNGTLEFLNAMDEFFDVNFDFVEKEKEKINKIVEKVQFYLKGFYGMSCAVVGDYKAIGFAKFLSDEIGFDIDTLGISKFYNMENKLKEIKDFVENVVIDDRKELEDKIMKNDIEVLFGSTYEKKIAQEKGIPLIRFSYPVVDEVSLINSPLAGFNGIPTIIERMINEIIKA